MSEFGGLTYPEETQRISDLCDEIVRGNKAAGEPLAEGAYRIQRGDRGWEAWHVPTEGLLAGTVQRAGLGAFVAELFVWSEEPNNRDQARAVADGVMIALQAREYSDG
jgi:hypothetical protein